MFHESKQNLPSTKENLGYCQDGNFEVPVNTVTMTVHVLTTLEMLNRGLLVVGYDQKSLDRVGLKKNISRFRTHYVCHPRVYADIFERLQTTPIEEAYLDCSKLGVDKTVDYFFMAIFLMAQYPTEEHAESVFSFYVCDRTFRTHAWEFIKKIAVLHSEVIVWPEWWGNPDTNISIGCHHRWNVRKRAARLRETTSSFARLAKQLVISLISRNNQLISETRERIPGAHVT